MSVPSLPGSGRPGRARLTHPDPLLALDGTDHLDTYTHDPGRYLAAVLAFIDQQVALRGATTHA